MFTSSNKRVRALLKQKGAKGIVYKNGIPDFSLFAVGEVKIREVTNSRSSNYSQADESLAKQWSTEGKDGKAWTEEDVDAWRRKNEYTWHELNDMKTVQLIPTIINTPIFKHLGGVGEYNIMKKKGL